MERGKSQRKENNEEEIESWNMRKKRINEN